MINKIENPVSWAMLMYELDDAKEHLTKLIANLESAPEYDETDYKVDLGHIYSHLNRAWNGRNNSQDISETEWSAASQFPTDLKPI